MSLTVPGHAAVPSSCSPDPPDRRDVWLPAIQPAFAALRVRMPSDRVASWLATTVVTALAGVIRFWGLGYPKGMVFDEVYYATEAREMLLNGGYENNPGYLFIVHPPLGKWLIVLGERLFGHTELGWRVPSAVAGTLAVLILVRLVRRMTRSTLLGGVAGLLLALDGLSVVHSRVALLDVFLQLLVLAGFACLVLDRDAVRSRLARMVGAGDVRALGPGLGPRPWRLLGGVLLGAGCGVKWSAVYFLAGFAVLSLLWDRAARRSIGVPRPTAGTVLRDAPWALWAMLVVPLLAYLATWTGWFLSENAWNRHWAEANPAGWALSGITTPSRWPFLPDAVRSLVQYHGWILHFHDELSQAHPYQSMPWAWLVDGRPVSYYYPPQTEVPQTCGATSCVREILAVGTPALWWAFLPALVWTAWLVISRRDWRAGAVWVAFGAGWLSWMINLDRTMFFFYMLPLVPFLVIAVAMALGDVLGPHGAGKVRRRIGATALSGYLALVVMNFVWLHPILVGNLITFDRWQSEMWFPSWI
ncbi:MAG: phospholipid carrier-dependent glycosyltransferase [Actinobacteria bacterium]|nr:phospholipid carrier-dependent glycosyltransferase [Actinomycetota bacterium]MBI3686342.1 phospholipid carrier-dependent glycosyltransferase [Actinomycetota bacterium]